MNSQENTQLISPVTTATTAEGNSQTSAVNRTSIRRIVFTYNNYNTTRLQAIIQKCTERSYKFSIGEEVGESGTPHLQGYIEFKSPVRWNTAVRLLPGAHIEKAKGDRQSNLAYTRKDGKWHSNFPLTLEEQVLKEYDSVEWYDWQKQVLDLHQQVPNTRDIHWFIDNVGNSGKSFLARYMSLKHKILIASGKKADVLHQVAKRLENKDNPETFQMVILDIPRHQQEFTNYGLLEELKNGIIVSGKYEGGTFVFPIPHVVVFSNSEPDLSKFSQDRWKIHRMEEYDCVYSDLADLLS